MAVQTQQSGGRQQQLELALTIPTFTCNQDASDCMLSVVPHACAICHIIPDKHTWPTCVCACDSALSSLVRSLCSDKFLALMDLCTSFTRRSLR